MIDYKKLPIMNNFKGLKINDKVYSEKHGLGTVTRFYNDQVIITFGSHNIRFFENEEEFRSLPKKWLEIKILKKPKITMNNQKTTLRELKRKRRLEKELDKILNSTKPHKQI